MSALYINTNDRVKPRFDNMPSFFAVDYEVPGPLVARMLAAQRILDETEAALRNLTSSRISNEQAHKEMEALWHEIEEIVRRFAGESAATKQSAKATEAPTSAPSDDSCVKQESRSSTKRKAIQST